MLRQHVQSSPPPRKTFARARLVPRMGKPPVAQVRATDREREVRLPRRRIPHVTPRSPPSRDDSTDVLLDATLSHHHARHPFSPAAPPRCDLVRASRTRVRQVHVTQRGPARGVRPGLRAVARADGRHASGSGGAGQRGRRRHHPAGGFGFTKKKRTDPRADTAAFGGKARRAPRDRGRLRRNLRTLGRGRRGGEGWCDSCRAYTRHNKSASPREEGHHPSRREAKENAARRVTRSSRAFFATDASFAPSAVVTRPSVKRRGVDASRARGFPMRRWSGVVAARRDR